MVEREREEGKMVEGERVEEDGEGERGEEDGGGSKKRR